jgi:hypothetical protein
MEFLNHYIAVLPVLQADPKYKKLIDIEIEILKGVHIFKAIEQNSTQLASPTINRLGKTPS